MKPEEKIERAYEELRAIIDGGSESFTHEDAVQYLKDKLAQPEQEPVAWMLEGWGPDCGPYFEIYRNDEMGWRDKKEWTPLYTTPPQRTWVGMTPEETLNWLAQQHFDQCHEERPIQDWIRKMKSQLPKEKNT